MSRPRWLWISAELPTTASTGRLVYSRHLAAAVEQQDVDVTMVGTSSGGDHGVDGRADCGVSDCVGVDEPLRGGARSLLSPLPNLSYACSGPQMRRAVGDLLADDWDCVVIDHLQSAWVADRVRDHSAVSVFVTHNHEATVRSQVAREAPWSNGRRIALTLDAWKAQRLERHAVASADVVTAITDEDRQSFEVDDPDAHIVVVPPGWSGAVSDEVDPMMARPRRVAILGSFEWHVKQQNLRMFLEAADPLFAEHGIEIVVGGRVDAGFRSEIERELRATRFVGWVDDPAVFFSGCRIGVVAEPLGGGFKLKSLDYVFHRVPMAVVAGSLTGLPLKPDVHYVEAPDHDRLARAIVDMVDRPQQLERLASTAHDACAEVFSWTGRGRALFHAVAAAAQ